LADDDTVLPDKTGGDFITEAMWDQTKDALNAARRYRLLMVYTTGAITYNGSNSLSWTADIKIIFMATNGDVYYTNTITLASSPFTTSDNQVIWCRLVNSNSNVTLNDSTIANFTRAADLVNQSGDVFILGYTDTTRFHYVGGISDHAQLANIGSNSHAAIDSHLGDATKHFIQSAITTVGTLAAGNVSARDTIGLLASKANGDIFYWDTTFKRLAKGDDGQHLELASGLPAWLDKPAGGGAESHTKSEVYFYEDFESYSNGDVIHDVSDDWPIIGSSNYFKASTTSPQSGSVSGEWKWGTSGEAGRHKTILPFNRTFWDGALKISYYWKISSTGGGTYTTPIAFFWDNSAANGAKLLHDRFQVPYIRHLSGNFQIYDDTSTFVNVGSASTGVWHLCEMWIRNANQNQNSRTQVHVKLAGSHFPSSTGWEDLHSTPADYDRVGIFGLQLWASWNTTIQHIDQIKVESFDPMSTAFS
jgi:hypothetical protein